jgi:hypothetical protein
VAEGFPKEGTRRRGNLEGNNLKKNIGGRAAAFTAALLLAGCARAADDAFVMVDDNAPIVSEAPAVEEAPMTFFNYITPPPLEFKMTVAQAPTVRGIYVTSNRAGGESYMEEILALCKDSSINAMVIDVKTEEGLVTFRGMPIADELGISIRNILDIKALINTLEGNGIYPIARLVAFKDNNSHHYKPELYIHNQDGTIWQDNKKEKWLNPYNIEACEYVLEFAKGAAEVGFKEIQFDYVRFAASSALDSADMGDTGGRTRSQAIEDFARLAVETLRPLGVKVSADVYGTVINSNVDARIVGQDYTELAKILDVICPMVYPSHYANGSMGLDIPDLLPYDTIYRSMELSNERLKDIPEWEHRALVRPWLQDFTATWIRPHLVYGDSERAAQIQGAYDAGLSEWLLWDPAVNYDPAGMEGDPSLTPVKAEEESDGENASQTQDPAAQEPSDNDAADAGESEGAAEEIPDDVAVIDD